MLDRRDQSSENLSYAILVCFGDASHAGLEKACFTFRYLPASLTVVRVRKCVDPLRPIVVESEPSLSFGERYRIRTYN